MCNRGDWRAFDTRHFDGDLAALEQCTECGSYRARLLTGFPVVTGNRPSSDSQGTGSSGMDIPDPDSGDGSGSVWGPE